MHTRNASDQVTAVLIAGLLFGTGSLLDVPRVEVVLAAASLYGVLIVAFTAYRRSLRDLQPFAPLVAGVVRLEAADASATPAAPAAPTVPSRGQRTPSRRRLDAA